MSLWRQITHGLRVLANRAAADDDLANEVEHYLDEATDAYVAQGMSPADARRAARMEVGSATKVREEIRESGWEHGIDTTWADLRYAARRLRGSPGFTAIAILTLALGIGATTAIFSAVNPILFARLPYPHPGRIVGVLELHRDGTRSGGTFAMYREFLERARSLDTIAVFKRWQPTITGLDQPELLEGQRVSAGYFHVLGAAPIVGRDFAASDDRFRGPDVVILSGALWQRRFNGDRTIVGREITLDDTLYTVVGVMPSGFENVLAPSAALWTPLQYDPSLPANGREWGHHLLTIARLRPESTMEQATGEINALGQRVVSERHPKTYDPQSQFAVAALGDELTRGVRPALLAILGAVILVLAIACVNVTNLLLARGAQRRGEFALRAALGAARIRLVRQLLTESVLLSMIGGAAGIVVARLGMRALIALSPAGLPRVSAISFDATVFAFAAAMTTIIGLAFGLIPALDAARYDPQRHLQDGSHRTAGGHRRTRSVLVVAEVALALVLLVCSGLLLRSMERLFAVPIGFDSSNLLTMQVQLVGHRFSPDAARNRFFEQALDAVRHMSGVAEAGFTSQLPLSGDRDEYGARFEASPTRPAETYPVFRYAVSPGYLETMRIPLLRGRLLSEHDGVGAPLVALISESVMNARFHGADPIGQRLRIGGAEDAPPFTVVGVVGDVKQMSLAVSDSGAVYHTTGQGRWVDTVQSLVVRARHRGAGAPGVNGDAAALAAAIRQAVWSVDKDQPVVRIATMETLLAASAADRRFALIVFEAFALTALALAAIGIYGVLSGSVTERTREIGVRAALGASRRDILALIVRQGLTLTAVGVVIGLAGAAAASGALVTLLFGVSRLDPITYVGVVGLLAVVSVLACSLPAWRAAHVDPAITLRSE